MNAPTSRNRLDESASPYLSQHADNPVAWQPWDDAALAAARERDVPIFLSVGYAACHWCHVMEGESFEDDAVAEVLNESFVPIKVDREERPDVDRVYQTACQLVSGRGGWPLSAWLTPSGEPLFVGTYFPRHSRSGMPGFLDVLEDVAASWADPEDREQLEERAAQLTSRVRAELEDVPESGPGAAAGSGGGAAAGSGAAGEAGSGTNRDADGTANALSVSRGPGPVERAAGAALRSADRQHGGWGRGPKFPQPTKIDVLFDASASARAEHADDDGDAATAAGGGSVEHADDDGDPTERADDGDAGAEYADVATTALAAMVDGGLYDHVGGGFHRYCTDREWVVPHFEKMLYDNAELPRVLLAGTQITGRDRYATVAAETLAFLDRELALADGGFASSLDARSAVPPERTADGEPGDDEEGACYVWTPDEVAAVLEDVEVLEDVDLDAADRHLDGDRLADLVCDRYGITAVGNFEGKTVLTVDRSIQDLAETYDLDPADVRVVLDGARAALLSAREDRPQPRRDEKGIAAWNGLAVGALAEASIVLDSEAYGERARRTLETVRERLWDGDRLARRYVLTGDADDPTTSESPRAMGERSAGRSADVSGTGYLEDYAFLARGALATYGATGTVEPLAFALDLADAIVEQFYDETAGTLYSTPASGESLIARPQEPRDQSTPSSLGVATDVLAALDAFVPHDRFRDAAERVVETYAGELERSPGDFPSLALAAERLRSGSIEVTVVTDAADASGDAERSRSVPAAPVPEPWRSWLAETYLPRRLLAPRPRSDEALDAWLDELGLEEAPPIWAGRAAESAPTAYVCRGFTCSRPLEDPDDAAAWLEGEAADGS